MRHREVTASSRTSKRARGERADDQGLPNNFRDKRPKQHSHARTTTNEDSDPGDVELHDIFDLLFGVAQSELTVIGLDANWLA